MEESFRGGKINNSSEITEITEIEEIIDNILHHVVIATATVARSSTFSREHKNSNNNTKILCISILDDLIRQFPLPSMSHHFSHEIIDSIIIQVMRKNK